MLAGIQWMVYLEVTRQLHVMAQDRESSPIIDRRSNHCPKPPTGCVNGREIFHIAYVVVSCAMK